MKSRMSDRERQVFEETPVLTAVLKLAFPTVIGQIILVIYNMADTFFIGQTGSNQMLTAVTVCMPAFMFLSAISNLFGVGGSSVIARSLGKGNPSRAKHTSYFSFWGCLMATILYSAGAFLLLDRFVNLLGGSDPGVHGYACQYLLVTVVIGGFGTSMNTLLGHLVRSEGRSLQASIGIALGGIMNIGLDPLFMFVILPKGSEILGAALATALSNLAALIYFVIVIHRNHDQSVIRFKLSRKALGEQIPRDVLISGTPACLMTLLENISYAVLDNLMAKADLAMMADSAMQAGIGVAKKVNMLAHCIVRGMSQGVLPLIGYSYASGRHRRMRKSVLISTSLSVLMATVCMVLSLTFSRQLVSLFNQGGSEAYVEYGARFLQILTIGGPFSAAAYAVISFFQAVGEGLKSFILAILRKGVLDIPLMFVLNDVIPVNGIVWATPIADIVCSSAAVLLFIHFIKTRTNLNETQEKGVTV